MGEEIEEVGNVKFSDRLKVSEFGFRMGKYEFVLGGGV